MNPGSSKNASSHPGEDNLDGRLPPDSLRVLIFGASGMLGQAAIRQCLLDPQVQEVKAVLRSELAIKAAKLRQLVVPDLGDLQHFQNQLQGYDACFFCLGASAAGLSEEAYRKINYDLPMAIAKSLVNLNAALVFVYVSGSGTDRTEKGGVMWARVKGKTENDLMKLPLKGAYMFRPGIILPKNGEVSKTTLYRIVYAVLRPLSFLLEKLSPKYVINTEDVARAMLEAAKTGSGNHVLESLDIYKLGHANAAKPGLKADV